MIYNVTVIVSEFSLVKKSSKIASPRQIFRGVYLSNNGKADGLKELVVNQVTEAFEKQHPGIKNNPDFKLEVKYEKSKFNDFRFHQPK